MNCKERCEIMRHCKFIENIEPETMYTPSIELIDKFNCQYYAHGDDPCIDADGVDVCKKFQDAGRFK